MPASFAQPSNAAGFSLHFPVTERRRGLLGMLQGFLALGLEKTSAGLGSVIIDSQPITVAVLASLFLGETLSAVGIGGLAIGVLGLLLLVCARAAHTLVRRVPSAPPLSPPRPLDFVRRNRPRAETRREEGGSSRNTHRRRGHRTHTHTHTRPARRRLT